MTSSPIEPIDRRLVDEALHRALSGQGAHTRTADVFDALDWVQAGVRPADAPHSIYQLLNHIVFWQDWVIRWLDGDAPPLPEHASGSWSEAARPATAQEWEEAVAHFRAGVEALDQRRGTVEASGHDGSRSRLGMLHTIATHNSYHVGQVVLLRQMLGAWPPPSGGLTW